MKVSAFFILAIAGMSLGSCTKCVDCHSCLTAPQICRNDFDSNDDYQDAVDFAENLGCVCDPKLK